MQITKWKLREVQSQSTGHAICVSSAMPAIITVYEINPIIDTYASSPT